MNDTYREEAAKLWLDIIHTYEDEPVRANASEVRAGILDSIAAMLRAIAEVKECERRIEAALALHTEWGIYDECGHDHAEEDVAAGRALEIEAVGLVCEEGRIQSVCRHCHLLNDEPHEDTDRGEWPCPTHKALTGEG